MIKIDHTHVDGFEAAIRGMRNPKNSWGKSDSHFDRYTINIDPNDQYMVGLQIL